MKYRSPPSCRNENSTVSKAVLPVTNLITRALAYINESFTASRRRSLNRISEGARISVIILSGPAWSVSPNCGNARCIGDTSICDIAIWALTVSTAAENRAAKVSSGHGEVKTDVRSRFFRSRRVTESDETRWAVTSLTEILDTESFMVNPCKVKPASSDLPVRDMLALPSRSAVSTIGVADIFKACMSTCPASRLISQS